MKLAGAAFAAAVLAALLPATSRAMLVFERSATDRIVAARDDGSNPRVIAHPPEPASATFVAPNGRWVAWAEVAARGVGGGAAIRIINAHGGRARLISGGDQTGSVAWSPDSRYLIFGGPTDAVRFDVVGRRWRHIPLNFGPFCCASFSPNGARVVIVSAYPGSGPGSPETTLFNAHSLQQVGEVDGNEPAWGRGGLATVDDNGIEVAFRRYGRGRGQPLVWAPPDPFYVYPVAWSANGRELLVAESGVGGLRAILVNVANGRKMTLPGSFTAIDGLSRDGRRVLGEVDGNVVVEGLSGAVRVVARGARSASWNG